MRPRAGQGPDENGPVTGPKSDVNWNQGKGRDETGSRPVTSEVWLRQDGGLRASKEQGGVRLGRPWRKWGKYQWC